MTTLFESMARNGGIRKTTMETTYEFHRRCPRADVVEMCGELEEWFTRYPVSEKAHFLGRFRGDDEQHDGAFFELYLHELLLKLGFTVEVISRQDKKTTPDFLVRVNGSPSFYMEATVANPSKDELTAERREECILEELDRVQNPNFHITLTISGSLQKEQKQPSGKKLRGEVERWLSGLDPDQIQATIDAGGALPDHILRVGNLNITVEPSPKPLQKRGREISHAILSCPWNRISRSHEHIRKAIEKKAGKYGNLDLPYIIAVNGPDEFVDGKDYMAALFGDPDGESSRDHNGVFFRSDGNRDWINTRVSAVLLGNRIGPFMPARKTPVIFHHPHAQKPLDREIWPLVQRVANPATHVMEKVEGKKQVEDIFRYFETPATVVKNSP